MKKQEEAKIEVLLFQATDYDEQIKKQIWGNIERELFQAQIIEGGSKRKKGSLKKWKFTLIGVAILMGGTLCAAPAISALEQYFGQTKSQDFYNAEEEVCVKTEAKLYKSELGYTTFYNEDYFDIIQMGNKEQFMAKTGKQDGRVEIELIKDKSYETLVEELRDNKVYGSGYLEGIQEIYSHIDEETNIYTGISLCDAGEKGVFKIVIEYEVDNLTAHTLCYAIENQFTDLSPVHTKNIEKGKGILKFEYNKQQYELARDTSIPDVIRLQKVDSNLSEPGDIVLSYRHRIDSAKVCMERAKLDHQARINRMKEWAQDSEDKKTDGESLILEQIPLFQVLPNDLNVSAIKIQTGTKGHPYWNYYIEDGKGGCYDLVIMAIHADGLEAVLESIEMIESDQEVMEVIDYTYQAVG